MASSGTRPLRLVLDTNVAALMAQYAALVNLVAPASVPRVVAGDADGDQVIAIIESVEALRRLAD